MKTTRWVGLGVLMAGGLWAFSCDSDVEGPGGVAGQASTTSSQGGTSQGGSSQGGSAAGGGSPGGASQGGHGPCLAATADYGDCDMSLGWAFDGEDCLPFSGCGCEPDCAAFSPDLDSCIAGCAGFCDESAFLGAGIADDGWGQDDYCDEIYTCVKSDVVPILEALFATIDCSGAAGSGCAAGEVRCVMGSHVTVSGSLFAELCSATLVEDVRDLLCMVLGP